MLDRFLRWLSESPPAAPPAAESTPDWPSHRPGGIVCFIDVDGVLHRCQNGSFEFAGHLEQILAANTCIELVLSSNWRLNASPDQVRRLFPAALSDRLRGVTPSLATSRAEEIHAYVVENRVQRYFAIDDDTSEFPATCPWLFPTKYEQGLDAAAMIKLDAYLIRRFVT